MITMQVDDATKAQLHILSFWSLFQISQKDKSVNVCLLSPSGL